VYNAHNDYVSSYQTAIRSVNQTAENKKKHEYAHISCYKCQNHLGDLGICTDATTFETHEHNIW